MISMGAHSSRDHEWLEVSRKEEECGSQKSFVD
jgi:hypothetical protein